ncbi:nucleotide exchange factor GrpE [Halovulum dunhuangense]|uniref:Protein GrpE n=1 Tax=Halovulum dunhuangense TaxID=1505036 RepID=A0A849KPU8_9RHOB|nr:nucleotide exchange factor GrpE [Halovulum dunhuangense]NNU79083.1 nucleotide exchange factor GrpE [Halovulum dunhuangense]
MAKDKDIALDDPEDISSQLAEDQAESDAAPEDDDLQAEIAALASERDELKDRLLRALAETENLRKRADRDRRDAELYGGVRLARDLLSVHDNLNRALDAIDETLREQAAGLVEGIELTQRDLLGAFHKHKIEKIEPQVGDRFDPKLHQAMFEAPVPGQPAGAIIQVMVPGFTIGERLLRPAQVGVSSGG